MKKYNLINNSLGWLCFVIAAVTYLLTLEPTASFWDCPEFISQGYKLEVGHPPGNPIFMLAARFFVNFAGGDPSHVAVAVNAMSALLSAGTILLLFWTITHLVRRLLVRDDEQTVSLPKMIAIMGSGLCGALVYTWSDTFWFSAVEGEVYAFSSFCTALVFWLILKWENRADQPHSDRYLILIAYIIGISIAVHLLNLLCIPAIVLVIYYRKFKRPTALGSLIALAVSAVIVALILYGLVPGFIEIAQSFELFFVNVAGLSYNMGVLIYAVIFIAVILWCITCLYRRKSPAMIIISFLLTVILSGIPFIGSAWIIPVMIIMALTVYLTVCFFVTRRLPVRILTIAALSILVIFIGYSSYALLLIRSTANPPMNQNAPDNVFALSSYLNREQYGDTPLFYGQSFASTVMIERDKAGNYNYSSEPGKREYSKIVKTDPSDPDKYVLRPGSTPKYNFTPKMLFPRMYSSAGSHPSAYLQWINASMADLETVEVPILVDHTGEVLRTTYAQKPTFAQNMSYFLNYQLNHMYWRYFMWNFAGRQNDLQSNGEDNRGNWISGIPFIDNARLGDQSLLPDDIGRDNKGHNVFYMLPLLLGLIGLVWQALQEKRGIEQFWVIFFLFFMTGIAIVLYLNQPPLQPRERDYAFAGSFYAFAIWVGIGVAALWRILAGVTGQSDKDTSAVSAVLASVAALVGLAVPLQMVSQTWDDHDRSGRYTTRDYGMNYLSSLDDNAVIFTNGDNDTFPLWYAQEVEGYRTDVRVVNLSYLTTDWYANQMRIPSYEAKGIPTLAEPEVYAYDRLQYNAFDPDDIHRDTVDVYASLSDLYRSPAETGDVTRVMRYPVMSIPSNIDAAVKAGVISESEAQSADPAMIVDFLNDPATPNAKGVTLSQVLSLDMLATSARNGWDRPVYVAMTVPEEYYLSLSDNMRNTGLAYQFTPLKQNGDGYNMAIDTDKMYRNVTERFRWGGLDEVPDDGTVYLDETVRRMVTTHRSALYDLASALYNEGVEAMYGSGEEQPSDESVAFAADRFAKSVEILDIIDRKLPVRLSPYSIQMGERIGSLYAALGEITGNSELTDKGLDVLRGEILRYALYVPYYSSLIADEQQRADDQYQRAIRDGKNVKPMRITVDHLRLSRSDKYVPVYLYTLLKAYSEDGGDIPALEEQLSHAGVDINQLQALIGYELD